MQIAYKIIVETYFNWIKRDAACLHHMEELYSFARKTLRNYSLHDFNIQLPLDNLFHTNSLNTKISTLYFETFFSKNTYDLI